MIKNCNFEMAESNRMHQKPDTISDSSEGGTTTYLQVHMDRDRDLGKIFSGDGVSLDTTLAIMYEFLTIPTTVFLKNRGTSDML